MDLAIIGGTVVDGTGRKGAPGSVLVEGCKVSAIVGPDETVEAAKTIDATGCIVAPGFIDLHTHSDVSLIVDPAAESAIRQGVTTQVTGLCGFAPAPIPPQGAATLRSIASVIDYDVAWKWGDYQEYLQCLAGAGLSINVVPLAGHIPLRARVVGLGDSLAADEALGQMEYLLEEMLAQGAWGLSLGLMFPPSMYAQQAELEALAKVVAKYQGLLAVHLRCYGPDLSTATDEAIAVARSAGVALEISHLRFHRSNTGIADRVFSRLEDAAQHLPVGFDIYPYTAGSANLSQLLPGWVQAGDTQAMQQRVSDIAMRRRIKQEMQRDLPSDYTDDFGYNVTLAAASGAFSEDVGLSIATIGGKRGVSPYTAFFDILAEEGTNALMSAFTASESNVRLSIMHDLGNIGSDGAAVSPQGVLGRGLPHPRYYGAYPRLLRMVREENLPLERVIYKMTGGPAKVLGLSSRGNLEPGFTADLVVFDAETVSDQATYDNPHQYPIGIHAVVVNGVVELCEGQHQRRLPGTVLRRGSA